MRKFRSRARRGVSLVILCLLFPVVLGIAAFAINIVYMELARTELQISTDLATRAAGRVLAVTGSQDEAIRVAEKLLKANPYCKKTLPLSGADIVFGVSTRHSQLDRYSFEEGPKPNAIRISANGNVKVPLLFPALGTRAEYRPTKVAVSTRMELDVVIVLDRSSSMAYSEIESSNGSILEPMPQRPIGSIGVPSNSRWLNSVNCINGFLNFLESTGQEEQVSLVSFALLPSRDTQLSSQYTPIRAQLQFLGSLYLGGPSNLAAGIEEGVSALSDRSTAHPWATRVMIIVSDGIQNVGADPLEAAQHAAAKKIHIYTISVSDEANITMLRQMAKLGLGKHQHANNSSDLTNAFKEIAHCLPTLLTY